MRKILIPLCIVISNSFIIKREGIQIKATLALLYFYCKKDSKFVKETTLCMFLYILFVTRLDHSY